MRKSRSGVRNVYQLKSGKWFARVRKDGKTYKTKPVDHFDQANRDASELRLKLNV